MMMQRLRHVLAAGAVLATFALATADEGQGPIEGDNVRVDRVNVGEHWYGAPVTNDTLVGKVVLVELWGS